MRSAITDHTRHIIAATFSFDGKLLVTTSYDNTACVYDCTDPNNITLIKQLDHTDYIKSEAFIPDSSLLVITFFDNSACIYDCTDQQIRSVKKLNNLNIHDSLITSTEFNPDSKLLVTTSNGRTACVYDLSEYINFIQSADSIAQVLKEGQELSERIKNKNNKNNFFTIRT
jgi:WD40 repeat protein